MDTANRVNRIIGQLKGIERMIGSKRQSADILQQMSAVKKAIDGLSKQILLSDIKRYLPERGMKKVQAMIERAINL